MITSQGFGMGALVNFEWKMDKELGMIVRQSRGYFWMVKRLSDGQEPTRPRAGYGSAQSSQTSGYLKLDR